METVIELPIANFEAQDKIFKSKAKYKIVAKGRRFGFTRGAANNFIEEALEGKFKKGLWVDVINTNIDRYIERYFMPHLQKLPSHMWAWRKQDKIVEINGSYIDFRSADKPESIEGFGYDKVLLNEAGIILKNEYLWNNAIKPMLWDYDSPAVIGGTPKVGSRLFRELFALGESPNANYESFRFSSFDNPYINTDRIKEDMANMTDAAIKQEIYGQFIDDQGVVFRGVKEIASASPQKPIEGKHYIIGCDLAKVQDYTVVVVYDRETNEQVFQDRWQSLEWPYQKQKIGTIAKHYNNALVYIDATGIGDPVSDDLIRSGISVEPIKISNQSKKELIEKLAVFIETRKIRIINIPETIKEFNDFSYDISEKGNLFYSAPPGLHDDIVIAHALAIHGLSALDSYKIGVPFSRIQIAYKQAQREYNQEQAENMDFGLEY